MAGASALRESWLAKAKGRLFPRKRGRQLVAEWQQRQLPKHFFGVARHAERADGVYAFWNGQRWTYTDDSRRWPLDPPLSDDGMEAAKAQGLRVQRSAAEQGTAVQVVISSPYFRCVQTAVLICKALGPNARLLIDWSLGEVYGPSVMGEQEPAEPVRGMDATLAFCQAHGVSCQAQVMGTWPCWPETLKEARRRYANRFLSFLQRSAVTRRNFVLVAHADTVGAALSMMPSLLDQSIEKVDYSGMLLASRKNPKAAVQSMNLSSVIPMVEELEGSDPEGFLPKSSVADFEELSTQDAANVKPRMCCSAWTKDDAGRARHQLGEPSKPSPQPNPPKAADGWEVELHDITMLNRRMAARLQKRVQDIASQGPFTQDRVRQLLGCMGSRPLSGEEADLPIPGAVPPSLSVSTFLFGAEDLNSESMEESTPTTPASLGELSGNGVRTPSPIRRSVSGLVSSVLSRNRRQPLHRSGQQRERSVQIIRENVRDEGVRVKGQAWAQSIAGQVELANARASRAASLGCTEQPPLGQQCQPPLVGGVSSGAVPAECADDPREQAASSDKASKQLPAGDLKPVTFRSLDTSSLMKRRLKSTATTASQEDGAAV